MEAQTALMTFAEFERLPDPPSGHLELHHGEVVSMPPRIISHFEIQGALLMLLRELEAFGRLSGEFPFQPTPEHEYWTADIGFVAKARWLAKTGKYFIGAPDLIIEVLSESNTMREMLDRQEICLDNGCLCFCVVDPKRQTIMVTTPDRTTHTYRRDERFVLPGILTSGIEVAAIFAPILR